MYENLKQRPYAVELLNIGDIFKDNTEDARMKLGTIDYFLKKVLEEKRWKPTTTAYRDVLEQVSNELKISSNLSSIDIMNRMYYFLATKDMVYGG